MLGVYIYFRNFCMCVFMCIIAECVIAGYQWEVTCKLTIRPRCCGKTRETDPIFRRNPSYPACSHKTVTSLTPKEEERDQNTHDTLPQKCYKDIQYDLLLIQKVFILVNRMVKTCTCVLYTFVLCYFPFGPWLFVLLIHLINWIGWFYYTVNWHLCHFYN